MGAHEKCVGVVHGARVVAVDEVMGAGWAGLVVVTGAGLPVPHLLDDFIAAHHELDPASKKRGAVSVVRCARVAGGRLVLAAAGESDPYDDVRCIGEAMLAGVRRLVSCGGGAGAGEGGGRVLVCVPSSPRWPRAPLVALLAALEALYQPLQLRETYPSRCSHVEALGAYGEGAAGLTELLATAVKLEIARGVARDIGGGDPERMTPSRAASYITQALSDGPVTVRVESDPRELRRRYPLFAAVDRAARTVPGHEGCVVFLEYEPAQYDRTYMFVGKGVTYDTGGCDVKTGGSMAGMSRDKCGAAAIAGLFKAIELFTPGVKATAALALVRNSVGAAGYVADELLTSRGGEPVRVGNTDAEGRMAMADLLTEMAERAPSEKNPHIYTVATLTGHAVRTVGEGYSIVMDNHVARDSRHAEKLRDVGDALGDMFEISTIRREDMSHHLGRCHGDALHQSDSAPSVSTPRGHQGPAGFLLLVSGLHRGDTPYSHLDVAGSAGSLPAPPTAQPLLALAAHMGLY